MEKTKVRLSFDSVLRELKREAISTTETRVGKNEYEYTPTEKFNFLFETILKSNNPQFILRLAETNLKEINYEVLAQKLAKLGDAQTCITFLRKYPTNKNEMLFDAIIKSGDPKANYEVLAHFNPTRARDHFDAILKSGDPEYNYLCAIIPGADINAHQQVVINSNNPTFAKLFALNVPFSNKKALAEIVLNYGTTKDNYEIIKELGDQLDSATVKKHGKKIANSENNAENNDTNLAFATTIPNATLSVHSKSILEKQDPYLSLQFLSSIHYEPHRKQHEQILLLLGNPEIWYEVAKLPYISRNLFAKKILESNSGEYNMLYAKDIPGADKMKHSKRVAELGDYKTCIQMIKGTSPKVNNFNPNEIAFNELQAVVIDRASMVDLIELAANIPGFDKKAVYEKTLNSNDPLYAYLYAKEVEGISDTELRSLEKIVGEKGDGRRIYEFSRYVKGADIKYLKERIEKRGTISDLVNFALFHKDKLSIQDIEDFITNGMNAKHDYNTEQLQAIKLKMICEMKGLEPNSTPSDENFEITLS